MFTLGLGRRSKGALVAAICGLAALSANAGTPETPKDPPLVKTESADTTASAPEQPAKDTSAAAPEKKMVCETLAVTGSRLSKRKVCRTAEEVAAARENTQKTVQDYQMRRTSAAGN